MKPLDKMEPDEQKAMNKMLAIIASFPGGGNIELDLPRPHRKVTLDDLANAFQKLSHFWNKHGDNIKKIEQELAEYRQAAAGLQFLIRGK